MKESVLDGLTDTAQVLEESCVTFFVGKRTIAYYSILFWLYNAHMLVYFYMCLCVKCNRKRMAIIWKIISCWTLGVCVRYLIYSFYIWLDFSHIIIYNLLYVSSDFDTSILDFFYLLQSCELSFRIAIPTFLRFFLFASVSYC